MYLGVPMNFDLRRQGGAFQREKTKRNTTYEEKVETLQHKKTRKLYNIRRQGRDLSTYEKRRKLTT